MKINHLFNKRTLIKNNLSILNLNFKISKRSNSRKTKITVKIYKLKRVVDLMIRCRDKKMKIDFKLNPNWG